LIYYSETRPVNLEHEVTQVRWKSNEHHEIHAWDYIKRKAEKTVFRELLGLEPVSLVIKGED